MAGERFKGEALKWLPHHYYGFLKSANGYEYLVHGTDVAPDCYGRRFLNPGEPILYSVVRRDGNLKAVEVLPLSRPVREAPDPAYREELILENWNGRFGFAKRPICGGSLFIHKDRITTLGIETLQAGSHLWASVQKPDNPTERSWLATDIQILEPEGYEPEPSAEPVTSLSVALQDALSQ